MATTDEADKLLHDMKAAAQRMAQSSQFVHQDVVEEYAPPSIFDYAKQGNFQALEMLFREGANPNEFDEDGVTPLHWAAAIGSVGCIQLLVQGGADINAHGRLPSVRPTALMWAARHPTIAGLNALIDLGAKLDELDANGCTAAMEACKQGNVHSLHVLLKNFPEALTMRDNEKHTLLHWAVYKDHAHVVDYLLKFYPSSFSMLDIDSIERNAVHWACRRGSLDCARALAIFSSANFYTALQARDDEGKSPLELAHQHQHENVIRWIGAMTEANKPIPREPLEQRHRLLFSRDSFSSGARWCGCVLLLAVICNPILPLGLTIPVTGWLGYTSSNYLGNRNYRKGASPILAVSLHLTGVWVGVAVSAWCLLMLGVFVWGVEASSTMIWAIGLVTLTIVMFIKMLFMDPGCIPNTKSEFEDVLEIVIQHNGLPPETVDPTRMLREVPRAHFSTVFGCRIGRYDHYCVWLQMPVGYKNHAMFFVFVVLHCLAQIVHLVVSYDIVMNSSALDWSGLWTSRWENAFIGGSLLNVMILCIMLYTFYLHATALMSNVTFHEMTHPAMWYYEDGANPFAQGSRLSNIIEFFTMHTQRIGGYGDVRLKCPPIRNKHGHSHGQKQQQQQQQLHGRQSMEAWGVLNSYEEMRALRAELRQIHPYAPVGGHHCNSC